MDLKPPTARRAVGLVAVVLAGAWLLASQAASSPGPSGAARTRGCPEESAVTDAVTVAEGDLPGGATPFDDHLPGIRNLDPDLLSALRAAATSAARDGVRVYVNSGWRSRAHQATLLCEAIATYGSEAEAARWVAPASASLHVSGDAVDVGPTDAMWWLSRHGSAFGLCRVYGNEPWHFELRPGAVTDGCPPMYADPTQDPRFRR
jgi:hypothetical protein